jgi:hypothetical protein
LLGYTVLNIEERKTTSKVNSYYIVEASCPKGHILNKTYECYKDRCPICSPNEAKWNPKSISEWLRNNRPHLKLVEYKNRRATLKCKIDGYTFTSHFATFVAENYDCAKCQRVAKITPDEFKKVYEAEGYKIIIPKEGITTRSKIQTICPEGHTYLSNFITFRDRIARCPFCQRKKQESKIESHITEWLAKLGYEVIQHNRKLLNGLEIDCYLPKHKLGIEFNGLYFHSVSHSKRYKELHYTKFRIAKEKGIKLLQFWEDDTLYRLDVVKSIILTNLGHESILKISSEKCNIKAIDKPRMQKFLKENDLIDREVTGGDCIGVFYQSELVMVGIYKKYRKRSLLQKVCSKKYTVIAGGLSLLFKYRPKPIVVYSDNLQSNGDVYEELGLILEKEIKPDYHYIRNRGITNIKRFSKEELKKSPQKQKLLKVYDAGKQQWKLN